MMHQSHYRFIRLQQALSGISHISFGEEEDLSPKKPATLPEVAKQRELSGTMENDSASKLKKQLSDAKYKEISGQNIFAPPPEIKPRSGTNRALASKDNFNLGAESQSAGEDSSVKTAQKIYDKKFAELSGNDIFKGDSASLSIDFLILLMAALFIQLPGRISCPKMSIRRPQIPRLLLQNVSCMRNAQQILRHVNVSLHDGGALVLTGTNGSGKSTFLRMLAGFSKPSAGETLWNGHDITQSGIFQQYKLQLNWISLKDAIKERSTVLDNVQWFELLENKIGKAQPALELMGLGRLVKEKWRMLSMGQRKRLQLARLLAIDRPIWLLDEPSVALDDEGVRLLEYIIAEHRKKGGIVIVATHLPIDIEDAMILRLPPRFPRKMTLIDMLDRADIS